VKVYNLTDVPTPALKRAGLCSVDIHVKGQVIPPGKFLDLFTVPHGEVARYLPCGALCLGTPPAAYLKAKAGPAPVEEPQPAPVPVSHETPAPAPEPEPEAPRCPLGCAHGDRCTLEDGHEGGCNFRECDCNEPSEIIEED
jgi:hypothetical protein